MEDEIEVREDDFRPHRYREDPRLELLVALTDFGLGSRSSRGFRRRFEGEHDRVRNRLAGRVDDGSADLRRSNGRARCETERDDGERDRDALGDALQ